MTDKPFTNRELKLMFEQLNDKLDGIYDQTKKTNGRLLKVEDKTVNLERAHTAVKAYAVAVSVVVGAIVTMANFVIKII